LIAYSLVILFDLDCLFSGYSSTLHHVAAVMKLPFSFLACLSYASANTQTVLDLGQQQAIINCKALATDGKTVNAIPDGVGGWNCVDCEGEAYTDSDGLVKCCVIGTKYTRDSTHPANGKCCPTGMSYTYDTVAAKGDCCPPGQTILGGVCTLTTPLQNMKPQEVHTKESCSSCGNGYVCSANGHLGIQYGHCYTMTDSNGKQIQRDEGYLYRQQDQSTDKTIGLTFRICNSTADCTQKQDQYVPENGFWFQLDQNGWRDGTSPGWMIFTSTWLLSMSTTWNTGGYPLANFTGYGTCFFGNCAISLQFGISDTSNLLGMASYGGEYLSRCLNLNSRRPYYYQEVPCNKEVNAWPGT